MSIKNQLANDMKEAMKARDQARLGALRLIRAELLKAEKEKGEELGEEREMAILQKLIKQRREAIEQYEQAGRADRAEAERAEEAVIAGYLPEPLSEAEVQAAIEEVLAELGPVDPQQLGKVMGQVMARLKAAGRPFDGKAVNAQVRRKLGMG